MFLKLAGLIVFAVVLTIAGAMSGVVQDSSDSPPVRGRIKWNVQRAKAKGQKKVIIPAPAIDYAGGAADLDQALAYYSVVVARPIAEKSVVFDEDNSANNIVTWYKLKLIETISRKDSIQDYQFPLELVPQEMLPLAGDELLVSIIGGTVVIDGVEVTMANGGFFPLSKSKDYLLMLRKAEALVKLDR